ncbi:MAG: MurR/RpiR family transcriptional regulator, partial [Acidobacteria bacterium]|nr:MurR/RpiR family transcriptional regulator [Acidobacteriota bacterium]
MRVASALKVDIVGQDSPEHVAMATETTNHAPTALEARFAQVQDQLPQGRREILQAIIENPGETFFLSSRGLAARFQVDPATIVRATQALGYPRFEDFATDLRTHFMARITPYALVQSTTRQKRTVADHIRHSLELDFENVSTLIKTLDVDRVVELADRIHKARRILVVGVDLAASMSWFLAYVLRVIGFDAESPVGSAGNLLHHTRKLTNSDLLIAISFGRCLRETVETVRRAKEKDVATFGITDSDTTPIARFCDRHLVALSASSSLSGSYTAPMALLNAIVIAATHYNPGRALAILKETEETFS